MLTIDNSVNSLQICASAVLKYCTFWIFFSATVLHCILTYFWAVLSYFGDYLQ